MTRIGDRRSTVWRNAVLALPLAMVLIARGVGIVDALRDPEPVATAFDEDAYYELAVARNLAAGEGITAAHGEGTSGVQPLWTFLLVPAFALFGDGRAALASIFLLSAALWLTAARIFAGLMTRNAASSAASLGGLAGLLCLIFFLCDQRLVAFFFSGLETGFYAAGFLLLWRWLDLGHPLDAHASWQRSFVFGLLLGALLLARNDAVLIVPFVLFGAAVAHPDRRALRRIALAAGVAAATFSPWLAYNYELTGKILPQGGLATSIGSYGKMLDGLRVSTAARALLEMMAPPIVPGVPRLPTWCLAASAIVLCGGFARLCRRDAQTRRMARSAAWLAAGVAALVVYYVLFSRATWMYSRYFMPVRLLAVAAWMSIVLDVLGTFRTWRAWIATALMLAAAAGSVVHTARWFGSSSPFMGEDLRTLLSAGLCGGPARIGMFDSGRNGYRCAPYVVNLDGKASLSSLHAHAEGHLLEYLTASRIDWLFLRDHHLKWLDTLYPSWRREFSVVDSANGRAIFARGDPERDDPDR